MCGIAGIFDLSGSDPPEALAECSGRMADAQARRGPDARGVWADPAGQLALGHRRLSILDLSPAGAQPMHSHCGRFVLCYNGEIYNHAELRNQIEAARAYSGRPPLAWRGHSDTEILLEALALWGVQEGLSRAAGMFALALWDTRERSLTLARDRLGEKPLYYAMHQGRLAFASELSGLRVAGLDALGLSPRVDRQALSLYLRLSCVPAPHSILQGVCKLPAAHLLTVSAHTLDAATPRPYWSLADCAQASPLAASLAGSDDELLAELSRLLGQSVQGQLVADVPLGALLSGGVDSTLVTALMARHSARPVRSFTIGFGEAAYDEAPQARAVAAFLGCEHTELSATAQDALDLVPRLAGIYGEPFADASQLPTCLVAELTRQHVTVCLSGDGGDELFAGYNRHFWAPGLWQRLQGLPVALRRAAAAGLRCLSPAAWDRLFSALGPVLPGSARQRLPGEKLHKLASALAAPDAAAFYAALVSAWPEPGRLTGSAEASWVLNDGAAPRLSMGSTAWMQYLDASWYLPEDILTKVDRAAMAVSLESRAPYLDHRVAEFALRLPRHLRVGQGAQGPVGKVALRRVLAELVPPELWERPKMGFGVPLDAWLRGPLKDWAAALLDPQRLAREGYFDPAPVARAWAEHQSGRVNRQYRLWPVLMFGSWLESSGVSE